MDLEILSEFGVTQNEQKIFAAVVKRGALSATAIAKETGLNRPYIYYALERLLEKGFISKITVRGRSQYQALPLAQIASTQEQKLGQLKRTLAELDRIRATQAQEVRVQLLKGEYVIKNIIDFMLSDLKPNTEILSLGIMREDPEFLDPEELEAVFRVFKEQNIKERVICKENEFIQARGAQSKHKTLKSELLGNVTKLIYDNTIIEIFYGNPLYATITKSVDVAATSKAQFELFWHMGEREKTL